MKSITAICVLKSGGRYNVSDVQRLRDMLAEHVTVPYEFVCLTDLYRVMAVCKRIQLIHNWKGWWSKIELFRPNLVNTERIIYFDLDKLILRNIDDLFTQTAPFIALKPFNPKRGKNPDYFASAIMAWDNNGKYNYPYNAFKNSPEFYMKRYRGDQDFLSFGISMSYHLKSGPGHVYWQDLVSGIYSYKRHYILGIGKENARIICFHGYPRHTAVNFEGIKAECSENISGK